MNDWNEPAPTGLPRRVYLGIFVIILILVGLYLSAEKKPNATPRPAPGTTASGSITDRECERRLQQALSGLHPERVVLNSSRIDRVAELTTWGMECAHAENLSALSYSPAANERWLTGEPLARTKSPLFSVRDAQHITISRLCGDAAARLSGENLDRLARVVELFDFVVRQTVLEPDDAPRVLPRTPLESLMLGRATAADRAWTFGVLLRQLLIDAVIVEPRARPEAWLIGVIGPAGEVWLFDPRLGIGIPSAADDGQSTRVEQPATLSDVRTDPSLPRKLDLEGFPYPLQEGDLSAVSIKIIGESSTFSERMGRVQAMLSGFVVFDGLGESALRAPGLAERVLAAGGAGLWNEEDVSVWAYPGEQMENFMQSGAENSPAWTDISTIFAGPTTARSERVSERVGDDLSRIVVERMRNPLRRVRMIHLGDGHAKALPLYLPIRELSRPPTLWPQDPRLFAKLQQAVPTNIAAADFAIFWTALAQYELGRGELAVTTLDQYEREFPLGSLRPAVPELRARSLALEGGVSEAIAVIEEVPERARTPRLTWLLSRWRRSLENLTQSARPAAGIPNSAR